MSNAIDTASRFGDIPFVEFTRGLVDGVFESLIESHISQIEEYSSLTQQLAQSLSTYINNTAGDVEFNDISNFILNYNLPSVNPETLDSILDSLNDNNNSNTEVPNGSADNSTWWSSLITNLTPAVNGLVNTIDNPNNNDYYNSLNAIIDENTIPTYQNIYDSVAALLSYNKYGMLQNMVKQGVLRLVVTDGLIETRLTFSTYDNSLSTNETKYKQKNKIKSKYKEKKGFSLIGLFSKKRKYKQKNKTVTINTAKSYQRDSSGTSVNIFGRVLINFKTDYAPLNG